MKHEEAVALAMAAAMSFDCSGGSARRAYTKTKAERVEKDRKRAERKAERQRKTKARRNER